MRVPRIVHKFDITKVVKGNVNFGPFGYPTGHFPPTTGLISSCLLSCYTVVVISVHMLYNLIQFPLQVLIHVNPRPNPGASKHFRITNNIFFRTSVQR